MNRILSNQELEAKIMDYYREVYGERKSDLWCEVPAANVRTFLSDGKFISLKSRILTGEVDALEE